MTMAMTRMTPCKAKAGPSRVALEDTHLLSSSSKQQVTDSSSVQVVVGLGASRSNSQVVAVELISKSCPYDVIAVVSAIPALLLTVCLERFIHFTFERSRNYNFCINTSAIEREANTC
jgi:hypothetical protein